MSQKQKNKRKRASKKFPTTSENLDHPEKPQTNPYSPPQSRLAKISSDPTGLKGWLILWGVLLGFMVLNFAGNAAGFSYFILNGSYPPDFETVTKIEFVVFMAMFGFSLRALWLFFKKRKSFPTAFVLVCFGRAMAYLSYNIGTALAKGYAPYLHDPSIMSSLAWGAGAWLYFRKSRRVRNTFIK